MQTVAVRLLTGEEFVVPCEAACGVGQLKASLELQSAGLRKCRLSLRGAFLTDSTLISDLDLRPSDFLVAFQTRKKQRGPALPSAPAHAASTDVSTAGAAAPSYPPAAAGSAGLRQQAASTPTCSAQHGNTTAAADADAAAAEESAGFSQPPQLASPGKPDTLLPGYLSRPNPSPIKSRLLPPPPVPPAALEALQCVFLPAQQQGQQLVQQSDEEAGEPAPKRARRTLLGLAAARYAKGGASTAAHDPAGGAHSNFSVLAPGASPSLPATAAVLPAMRFAPAAPLIPAAVVNAPAAVRFAQQQQQPQQAQQARKAPPPPQQQQLTKRPQQQSQPQQPQQQQQQHLFEDLRAELFQAGQPEEREQTPGSSAAAAEAEAASAAGSNNRQRRQAAPQAQAESSGARRRPSRGAGSKRKEQPAEGAAASKAAAGAALPSGPLRLTEPDLDAAAAALPVPPLGQRLEAGFLVLAQLHAFLTSTHIQTTWKNVREAVEGMRLRQALTLEDCHLLATLCPELVSVQQHHRAVPRLHRDTWRPQLSSPQKVRAAVASAAATEAAAGGADQPLPNPMHLRSDGAGTVFEPVSSLETALAGQPGAAALHDDTHVIEVVDPGRGFLSRPIPPAFLAQLREAAAATAGAAGSGGAAGGREAGQARPGAEEAEVEAGSGAEEEVEEEDEEFGNMTGGMPAGQPPAGTNGGVGHKPRAFRINKLVRQRWCFRRALIRALLLVQQQQTGLAGTGRRPAGAGQQGALLTWYPCFDPAVVTPAQLAAAGEQLSAPARASAAAAEQESAAADALAAARRLLAGDNRAAPSVAAAAGLGQRAVARPPQLSKQHAPCNDTTQMGTQQFLAHLKGLPWYQGQVVHVEELPSRQAQHAAPTTPLAPAVTAALQLRGVRQLFTHQAAAMDHLMQGRHTVVATSTASGKSLCYLVPILQALAQDRAACALLMFPTKALAQDQLRALRELVAATFGSQGDGEAPPPAVHVYDGDTPTADRDGIREQAQLLITNPDMLHQSVLPMHQQFGRLLSNLRYVVVDEGHAYKGVFGCHTALVLRRLRRLCERQYHSEPTFAVTTATVANPREHACQLLGVEEVQVVLEDGSPHGPKSFVMWNPPLRQGWAGGFAPRIGERAKGGGWRAQQAEQRRRKQEANQERRSGPVIATTSATSGGTTGGAQQQQQQGSAGTAAEQLAAAKLSRRRQQLAAAVGKQPSGQAEGPPQQDRLHGAASTEQHQQVSEEDAPQIRQQQQQRRQQQQQQQQQRRQQQQQQQRRQQQQQQQQQQRQQQQQHQQQQARSPARQALPAALQREVEAAKAAIASVSNVMSFPGRQAQGGWQAVPAPQPAPIVPPRPVIRRRGLSAGNAVHQLAGGYGTAELLGSGAGSRVQQQIGKRSAAAVASGGAAIAVAGQAGQAARGEDEGEYDDDAAYRARLPGIKEWREAQAAAAAAEAAGTTTLPSSSGGGGGISGGLAAKSLACGTGGKVGVEEDEEEEEQQRRSSPIVEVSLLLAECVQHGLRTIAFCKSRKLCELVTAYVREILKSTAPELSGSIAVYRAGYSPAERREIERALFLGNLRAVAATNALELGVDVGSLDCTLHLGFPGSVASLWQQAGRAGRREQSSLALYLGWDGPLDQYFMQHPDQLFGRPIERAMVDPRNPSVLEAHAACAAAEAPLLLDADQRYFGPGLPAVAASLQAASLLGRHPLNPSARALHYIGSVGNPASKVSLRAIDAERYAIVDESQGGAVLEEIEESKAFFEVYDGAVYMYQGRTYLCKKLDLDARVAVVRPAELKYYTRCIDFTDIHCKGGKVAFAPAAQLAAQAAAEAAAQTAGPGSGGSGSLTGWGKPTGGGPAVPWNAPHAAGVSTPAVVSAPAVCTQALVTTRWLGFRRIWRGTGQVFDTVDLFLPDVQFETEAAYIRLPPATRQQLKEAGLPFRDGVHAACHALLNVLPLFLMCNPNDVGTECDNPYDTRYKPERLLLYDKHPGGIGLTSAAAPLFPQLVRRALLLVRECACTGRAGCPACVQHPECGEYNQVLHKRAAAIVLSSLLGEEAEAAGGRTREEVGGGDVGAPAGKAGDQEDRH